MDTNNVMDDNIEGQMNLEDLIPVNDAQVEADAVEEITESIRIKDLFQKYTNAYDHAVVSGEPLDVGALFRDNIKTRHYLEIQDKLDLAESILPMAMERVEDSGSGYMYYNKNVGDMAVSLAIVRAYTSIDTADEDSMVIYDMVSAMGLIDYLRGSIGDVANFERICEYTVHSLEKTHGMEAIVCESISAITTGINTLLTRFTESIEGFTPEHIAEVNNLISSINDSVKAVRS